MSCAGLWSHYPLKPTTAKRMLQAFAHPTLQVQSHNDREAHVSLAEGSIGPGPASSHLHPSGVRVCGDLRLDAPTELAETLGVRPGVHDERWLVIEAYQRWGLDFAERLYGDFGFAVWDRACSRMLLVRDPGGARPMFFATDGLRVAFASHPRGLLSLAEVSRRLDERAVLDYLGELPQEEAATMFGAVRRLPPASMLVVSPTAAHVTRYFDVTQTPELRLASDAEYAAALREELSRAVASRARGRCAVLLSGGLDSSAVAALAERARPPGARALTTISVIFPDFPECDERPYQAAVLSQIASSHHEVQPDAASAAGDFGRLSEIFSDPSFIGPHWMAWAGAEVASREGVSTVLTGIDGDRVVSHGRGRFADLAAARDWRGLAREVAAEDTFSWPRRLRVFASQALFSNLPTAVMDRFDAVDPRRERRFDPALALIRPELARRHAITARLRRLPKRPRSTRHEHARTLLMPDRNWDVELLDQLGSAFGLQFQQPFFDRRVMQLCYSFPGSQKRHNGWSRYVLRNALAGLVPSEVPWRRLDTWFDRPYGAWARAWLRENPPPERLLEALSPYLDVPVLANQLSKWLENPNPGPVDLFWRCVIMSRWLHGQGLPCAESFQPTVQLT